MILDNVIDLILEVDPGRDVTRFYSVVVTPTPANAGANMISLMFEFWPSGRLRVVCGAVNVSVLDLEKLLPAAIELLS